MPATERSLNIRTPEGVEFSLQLAGPVTRFLAWLIDAVCIWGAVSIAGAAVRVFGAISADLGMALYTLLSFVISIGYAILLEWVWRGQTIGKRIMQLRVMDRRGLKLQLTQVMIRNLLRVVDSLPLFYMVGGITSLFNRKAQRLGDLAAHTIVIRTPKIDLPDIDKLFPDKYNSLRDYPHLVARLRQKVGPGDAILGLQALLRRDELEASARLQLFAELSAHYRSIVPFPDAASENLSDERFTRNVIDVLYRKEA